MSSRCEDPECCDPDRRTTERTQGVWTTCDECGANWWCVASEWDWMDEPTAFVCSGGCEDGYDDTERATSETDESEAEHG